MIDLFKKEAYKGRRLFRKYDRRVWYLFLTRIFISMGFGIVIPFLSVYLYSELGVPMKVVGTIFLFAAATRAVMQLFGGELSDRFGRRKIMLWAMGGRAVTFFLLSLAILYAQYLIFILVAVVLSYGFGAMFMPSADAMIADLVEDSDRIEAYGIQRIGLNAGWAIGPAIGGFLASISYFWLFFLTAILFVIGYGIIQFYVGESNRERRKESSRMRLEGLLSIRNNHNFLLFSFYALLVFSIMTQIVSTLSVYAVSEIGLSKVHLGFLYTINGVIIIFLQFPGISLIKKVKLTTALAGGAFLVAAGYVIIMFANHFLGIALAIVLLTFGEIFITPAGTTLTSNWAPAKERGRYMGVYGLFQSFGRSFGPFYGGFLLDALIHDPTLLWGIIAAIGLVSSVGFFSLQWKIPSKINSLTAKSVS